MYQRFLMSVEIAGTLNSKIQYLLLRRRLKMNPEEKKSLHKLAQQVTEGIAIVLEQIAAYDARDDLSEAEEKEYRKLRQVICEVLPIIRQLADVFGQEAFQAAQAYYYNLQEKAQAGNPKAQEIYNELKPLYDQALLKQVDKN